MSPQELAAESSAEQLSRAEQSRSAGEESFDWWSAPPEAREKQEQRREAEPGAGAESGDDSGAQAGADDVDARVHADVRADADADAEVDADAEPDAEPDIDLDLEAHAAPDEAAIYRAVHESPEFREIRTRYRRFVLPATAAFLLWYLLYVVLAVSAPRLMARPIAGPLNTAWLLGLLQFVSTFLLAWLYARHARAHRDRAALGLRWETQDRLR